MNNSGQIQADSQSIGSSFLEHAHLTNTCSIGSSRQPTSSARQIPQQQYTYFDKPLSATGVLKKLREFNQVLSSTEDTQALAVSPEQSQAGLEQLLTR